MPSKNIQIKIEIDRSPLRRPSLRKNSPLYAAHSHYSQPTTGPPCYFAQSANISAPLARSHTPAPASHHSTHVTLYCLIVSCCHPVTLLPPLDTSDLTLVWLYLAATPWHSSHHSTQVTLHWLDCILLPPRDTKILLRYTAVTTTSHAPQPLTWTLTNANTSSLPPSPIHEWLETRITPVSYPYHTRIPGITPVSHRQEADKHIYYYKSNVCRIVVCYIISFTPPVLSSSKSLRTTLLLWSLMQHESCHMILPSHPSQRKRHPK